MKKIFFFKKNTMSSGLCLLVVWPALGGCGRTAHIQMLKFYRSLFPPGGMVVFFGSLCFLNLGGCIQIVCNMHFLYCGILYIPSENEAHFRQRSTLSLSLSPSLSVSLSLSPSLPIPPCFS